MLALATIAAAPVPLRLADRTLLMTPLTLSDYGEIVQALLADRAGRWQQVDGDDVVAETLDARDSQEAPAITAPEMAQWMCGTGLAYVLWLVLRRRQPELTLDDCQALAAAQPHVAELAEQLDRASGLPVGNASSQAAQKRTAATRLAA